MITTVCHVLAVIVGSILGILFVLWRTMDPLIVEPSAEIQAEVAPTATSRRIKN